MIIKTLVENTSFSPKYKHKHGVCFYIETQYHKILFDLGPNGLFLENARKLGVNIGEVDTVIISHGHTDHAGALNLFLKNNSTAKVYVRSNAFDKHYTNVLGLKISVGIDCKLKNHPQIVLTDKLTVIDDELTLFSDVTERECFSRSNNELFARVDNSVVKDDFSHEQSLIISENGNAVLFAGCAHMGIVNIKKKAQELSGGKLTHVIGGFHLYNPISKKCEKDSLVNEIALRLDDGSTQYYTCHCTGTRAFNSLKKVLSARLNYLAAGSEVVI